MNKLRETVERIMGGGRVYFDIQHDDLLALACAYLASEKVVEVARSAVNDLDLECESFGVRDRLKAVLAEYDTAKEK